MHACGTPSPQGIHASNTLSMVLNEALSPDWLQLSTAGGTTSVCWYRLAWLAQNEPCAIWHHLQLFDRSCLHDTDSHLYLTYCMIQITAVQGSMP